MRRQEELKIILRKLIFGRLTGAFPSSRFGPKGLEFAKSREIEAGDEMANIDWVKSFQEQRYFTDLWSEKKGAIVFFLIDTSKSVKFGTSGISKKDLQKSLIFLLGEALNYGSNRIGFVGFSELTENYHVPGIGVNIPEVLEEIEETDTRSSFTDINPTLQFILEMDSEPSLIFILSDFIFHHDYRDNLATLSLGHDVIPFVIRDLREKEMPKFRGYAVFKDLESGNFFYANSLKPSEKHKEIFGDLGLDWLEFSSQETEEECLDKLIDLFQERERRLIK